MNPFSDGDIIEKSPFNWPEREPTDPPCQGANPITLKDFSPTIKIQPEDLKFDLKFDPVMNEALRDLLNKAMAAKGIWDSIPQYIPRDPIPQGYGQRQTHAERALENRLAEEMRRGGYPYGPPDFRAFNREFKGYDPPAKKLEPFRSNKTVIEKWEPPKDQGIKFGPEDEGWARSLGLGGITQIKYYDVFDRTGKLVGYTHTEPSFERLPNGRFEIPILKDGPEEIPWGERNPKGVPQVPPKPEFEVITIELLRYRLGEDTFVAWQGGLDSRQIQELERIKFLVTPVPF